MIRGIMFDFDGTLTSAGLVETIVSCVEADSSRFTPKMFWDAMLRFSYENPALHAYGAEFREYFRKTTGITIKNDFYKDFRDNKEESPLRPELPSLLKELSKRYKLGVFTGIRADKKRSTLKEAGLLRYFVEVYPLSEDVPKKPHPDAFTHAEGHFGITRSEVLLVDDNPVRGILGAKLHGWKTCFLNPDGAAFDFPRGLEPDYEIKSLTELPHLLEAIK